MAEQPSDNSSFVFLKVEEGGAVPSPSPREEEMPNPDLRACKSGADSQHPPSTPDDCAHALGTSTVTHLCTKPKGHTGAHTDGAASWGAHKWITNDPRWPNATRDLTCCERCGVVQRADGQNKPCRGVLPKITMRDDVAQSAATTPEEQPATSQSSAFSEVGGAAPSPEVSRSVDQIIQQVAELPDRTSPDDWPEAMLVTADELRRIIVDALNAEGPRAEAAELTARLFEECTQIEGASVHGACFHNYNKAERLILQALHSAKADALRELQHRVDQWAKAKLALDAARPDFTDEQLRMLQAQEAMLLARASAQETP